MKSIFVSLSIFCFLSNYGQLEITALKKTSQITIDGQLNEKDWKLANWATGFTQLKPVPSKKPTKSTKVAILYDQEAIYIGAKCFDHPDSVSKVLSIRDDFNPNLDVFAIFIDTYQDKQNGFFFGLTSRGVQLDAKVYDTDFNDLFNLVWRSKTQINDEGWFAEIKIPYSALRFPKKEVQSWNINFARQISRFREENTWSPVKPDLENYLLESGVVKGIKNITPPLRLAFIPFLSNYTSFSKNTTAISTFNGGMDVKYGVNEAFTLDITLLPDFGQVVFDQQVLNISPFEIQFNENRQFFTEGTELFNKADVFYSRRIGVQTNSKVYQNQLEDDEQISELPASVPLINASKISGRLENGLGIGLFNGITAEQKAFASSTINEPDHTINLEREITISPLTNYNVIVLDQNLKNNSYINFTNTNVLRQGNFYDANVTSVNTSINSKNNDYFIDGEFILSNIIDDSSNLGHSWGAEIGKQRGQLAYGIEYYEESDTYDPNDLGFLRANNSRVGEVYLRFRDFNPKNKNLNKIRTSATISAEKLYKPNLYGGAFWEANGMFVTKSFNAAGLNFNGTLGESNDYFEPRGDVIGEYKFIRPVWINSRAWFSSNYQKRIAVDVGFNYIEVKRNDWWEWNYDLEFRFRINNQINLIHGFRKSFQYNSEGYAVDFGEPANQFDGILFGNRDRFITTQSLGLDYTMTNRIGMTFRLRHYNAKISYNYFSELLDDGRLYQLENYSGNDINGNSAYDINYNAFTIDMLFRWVFFPGSELNLVWKNSIFTSDGNVNENYWLTLNNTLQNGPMNTISLKLIYWLDARYFKKKKAVQP
ncbi:MAG: hypothetical protein CL846_04300 [Crocinitomicaceae bacterium]|nr:hypothetical protein [Crocinitomicaceae bacterium]|tara:strand:+ start:2234 stop:4702 length:2469 start_codon:yes stop_codon:yes gene_type:complete